MKSRLHSEKEDVGISPVVKHLHAQLRTCTIRADCWVTVPS